MRILLVVMIALLLGARPTSAWTEYVYLGRDEFELG